MGQFFVWLFDVDLWPCPTIGPPARHATGVGGAASIQRRRRSVSVQLSRIRLPPRDCSRSIGSAYSCPRRIGFSAPCNGRSGCSTNAKT